MAVVEILPDNCHPSIVDTAIVDSGSINVIAFNAFSATRRLASLALGAEPAGVVSCEKAGPLLSRHLITTMARCAPLASLLLCCLALASSRRNKSHGLSNVGGVHHLTALYIAVGVHRSR